MNASTAFSIFENCSMKQSNNSQQIHGMLDLEGFYFVFYVSVYILQEIDYCRTVVLSVHDDVGVRTVMQELLAASQSPTASECWSAVVILHTFCDKTSADYSDYLPQLFRGLIGLFTNSSEKVLHAAWDCLNAVTKVSTFKCNYYLCK